MHIVCFNVLVLISLMLLIVKKYLRLYTEDVGHVDLCVKYVHTYKTDKNKITVLVVDWITLRWYICIFIATSYLKIISSLCIQLFLPS